ncbi:response regulator transcription factor [Humibacter sp.]|jgi:DNA-binding NarL/FixJ family response regulator|uniref:response regulator transcription factor n=1 Tax=Humibacter sp. TaxID=1940291 RepID=UPI002C776164|nr:response regulator transcription factor [Humibacter sp.]HVX06608.1 response regulator transcription factor [Humibacter sp.]
MTERIRVALVDDQALFRAGVRMLIESQPDLEFAGEAANGLEAVELASRSDPDVILMDIRMPELDGVAATARIVARNTGSTPRVLVLTTFDVDESAARAIQAGASGFVLKDADPEFLLAAIRTVHAGNAVIAASATRRLLEQFTSRQVKRTPPELETLTARERQIFDLAARALSNGEIAGREYLSEATVKTHISRVLTKLGLRDRVQLVAYAYENGLVERTAG